jgi:arylsulfatase A-like enzyme
MRASSRLTLFLLVMACGLSPAGFADARPPNVVIILADDLGWNDVGYHGSEIRTPALDALAAQGVVLNQYHSQPTCSPTRAALMTGKSPQRMGVYRQFAKYATRGLPAGEQTLADHLKQAGYQTWLVGKWHLGYAHYRYHPNARGFDHFYGHVTGGIGYWDHVHGGGLDWQRNGETLREDGYSTALIADEAVSLIRQRDADRPFFLYASFNAPHLPNEAPAETLETYAELDNPLRRVHAAMVTELDSAVSRIVTALAQAGEVDNTVIWFMSDNGGLNRDSLPAGLVSFAETLENWFGAPLPIQSLEFIRTNALDGGSDNSPLRHGKGSVYEGGARVPSFVYWPEKLPGSETDAFITVQDVLPTVLAALALPVPAGLDGSNRFEALAGREAGSPGDYVTRGQFSDQAYYQWPWKLISGDGRAELYHLVDDPAETRDLAAEYPGRVSDMQQLLDDIPRGEDLHIPTYRVFMDPDFFGGEEDREPWGNLTVREEQTTNGAEL